MSLWAVLLVAASVVSERRDRPTVPEQRDAVAAAAAVDRATGTLLAAVGPDRVFSLGPLVVQRDCAVTPVRPGATTSRDITVHTAAGEAPAVLDAIGAALPAGYRAEVTHRQSGTVHRLLADAGDFIEVRGTVAQGVITLRARSGCRPLGEPQPTGPSTLPGLQPSGGRLSSSAPAALVQVLAALGATASGEPGATASSGPVLQSVSCPAGTTARTAVAKSAPPPADLGSALRPLTAGATVVEASTTRYAFRSGATSVVVTVADGGVHVTASTGC